MADQLDVALEDTDLLVEVELTTDLMIAASTVETALPQAEVDRVLGLDEQQIRETAASPRRPANGLIPVQRPAVD